MIKTRTCLLLAAAWGSPCTTAYWKPSTSSCWTSFSASICGSASGSTISGMARNWMSLASRSLLVTWFFENVQVSAVCKLKKNKYTVHTAVDSVSGDEERNDFALLARVLVNNLLIRFNSQTHTNNQPVWIRYVGLVQKHTFVIHVYHLSKIFCFAIKTDTNLLLRPHRPYVSGCTYQRVWRLRTLHLLTENDQMLHSILYSYKGITLNWWKGKHSLHEKTAASVLLKLFISGNEWCHTTDAPSAWAELHFQM